MYIKNMSINEIVLIMKYSKKLKLVILGSLLKKIDTKVFFVLKKFIRCFMICHTFSLYLKCPDEKRVIGLIYIRLRGK